MPQKSRKEKERAAQKRETTPYKYPVAPAPITETKAESAVGFTTTAPTAAPAKRSAVPASIPLGADSEFDYSYVYADLRRIAILAALCFGIMIVLYFIIR